MERGIVDIINADQASWGRVGAGLAVPSLLPPGPRSGDWVCQHSQGQSHTP